MEVFIVFTSAFNDDFAAIDSSSRRSSHLCSNIISLIVEFLFTFTHVFSVISIVLIIILCSTQSLYKLGIISKKLFNNITWHWKLIRIFLIFFTQIMPKNNFFIVGKMVDVDQLVFLILIFSFTFSF